jgi:hypothetical protein
MNIIDSLTDAELSGLPDDEGERFAAIVRITRPKFEQSLASRVSNWTPTERKLSYASELQSCAKVLGIERLSEWSITVVTVEQFLAYAEGFVSQQRVLTDMKLRDNLVRLGDSGKIEIGKKIADIRHQIDISGLSERRKKILHDKLDSFEKELAKPRSNAAVLIGTLVLIMATVSDVGGTVKAVQDSSTWIIRELSEAHVSETRTSVGLPALGGLPKIEDQTGAQ